MNDTHSELKYRADIDGLRAIAVLSVVLFHAFPQWFRGGFIGVDVFFVISGYLISSILFKQVEANTFSFFHFYSRRIRRIFPSLAVVLLFCLGFGWFNLLADEFKQLGKHVAAGTGFISNFILWRESGYFDAAAIKKPLLHLWSLGIEEQFYIVWPLVLFFLWKRRLNLFRVTILVFSLSFLLNLVEVNSNPIACFYSPQTRFWELLSGSLFAWFVLHKNAKPLFPNFSSSLGLGLILSCVFFLSDKIPFPGFFGLFPTLGAVLLIQSGNRTWVNRFILSNRIVVFIGLISYPIYLWHWPLLSFLTILNGENPLWYLKVGALITSVFLAWISYRYIEKPLRFGQYNIRKVFGLIVAMAILGSLGAIVYLGNGLPFRKTASSQNKFIDGLAKITDVYAYFDADTQWRDGTCHAKPKSMSKEEQMNLCIDNTKPLILIWGDSYAASLYYGLHRLQETSALHFGIAQFTDDNGSPFFDQTRYAGSVAKGTKDTFTLYDVNNEKLDIVRQMKPELILISWMFNSSNGLDKMNSVKEINLTVQKIKHASPATKVVIIGPFPHWKGNLKDVIVNYAHEHRESSPPQFMRYDLDEVPQEWDTYFKTEFLKLGINYISAIDSLCNEAGCFVHTDEDPHHISAMDWGHLTRTGSEHLFFEIKGKLKSLLDSKTI